MLKKIRAALIDDHGRARRARPRLGCVTNKASRFTHPLLERMGLRCKFSTVVCGDEVERGKPDPGCYLLGCRRLAREPAETIVVGDSDNDVSAARAGGLPVVCVPYGYNEGRPVQSLGADAIVPDLLAAALHVRRLNDG